MIFQVFAFTSTSLFGSSLLIGLQAFLRMWLSQQGPQGPVSIPTGLCKPTLLYLTHQGSLHIAPFRGKCLTWLAVGLIFFFGHGRQEIILAWKHYFRWLKMLQYFYFPSSRWSSCLSSADELMPYFLQGWQRFPKSQKSALVVTATVCSGRCFWSCSIKNISPLTLKTWGGLSSCGESAIPL